MAYARVFSINLGGSFTGKTLNAQLVDTAGANVGSAITSGFTEIGGGSYMLYDSAVPAAHRGGIKIYEQGVPGTLLAFGAINPEEAEYVDTAVSTRLATSGYTAPDNATISSISGRVPAALISGRIDATIGAYQTGLTPLQPTVAGRTLDVSATGEAGIDLANVGSPTTTLNLSGTTISTSQVVASVTGAVGSVTGLTVANLDAAVSSRAPASTALSNLTWTDAKAAFVDAAISSRSTYAGGDTSGTTTLLSRITAAVPLASDWTPTRAAKIDNLDAAVSTRSTFAGGAVASVTGNVGGNVAGSVGSVVGLDASKIDAAVSSRAPASTALSTATWDSTKASYLDAAVSSRSIYDGSDTSGTTTLLTRIPGTVQPQTGDAFARIGAAGAGLTAVGDTRLANLDATVSSRSTFAGGAVASVTGDVGGSVQGNVVGNVGGNVTGSVGSVSGLNPALIDVAVSTRLAPTVAGRTLDVSAGGEAGIDWANVGSKDTVVGLSGTTVEMARTIGAQGVQEVSDAVAALIGANPNPVPGGGGIADEDSINTSVS